MADWRPELVMWETIYNNGAADGLERMKVPGGWLYCRTCIRRGDGMAMAMSFVPDIAAPDK